MVTTLDEHEAWIQAAPDYYTAVAMLGSGQRDRAPDSASLEEARDKAKVLHEKHGRGALLYAVRNGQQSHVENYPPTAPYRRQSKENPRMSFKVYYNAASPLLALVVHETEGSEKLPLEGIYDTVLAPKSEADLLELPGPMLVYLYNLRRRGAPVTRFATKEDGARRVFTVLSVPPDMVNSTAGTETKPLALESVTPNDGASAPETQPTGDAAGPTDKENSDMTAAATKTPAAKRGRKPAAEKPARKVGAPKTHNEPKPKKIAATGAEAGDPKSTKIHPGGARAKLLAKLDGTKTFNQLCAQFDLTEAQLKSHLNRFKAFKGIGHVVGEDKKITAVYPKGMTYDSFVTAKE